MLQISRPTFLLEKTVLQNNPTALIIGMDEAGCGPWAGSLVAGAVAFFSHHWDMIEGTLQLNDSKKLSSKKREGLFPKIHDYAVTGVGIVSVEEIDEMGLAAAHRLSLKRAMTMLLTSHPHEEPFILMDGIRQPKLPYPTQMIVKGDSKSCSIAAASILAKVTRDRLMQGLSFDFPQYGWEKNAGYGTKAHQEALKTYGVTAHHRRSYAPIQKFLRAESSLVHIT